MVTNILVINLPESGGDIRARGSYGNEGVSVFQIAMQRLRVIAMTDLNHLRGAYPVALVIFLDDSLGNDMHRITV